MAFSATSPCAVNQLRRGQPGCWSPSFASPKEGDLRKGDPGLPHRLSFARQALYPW